VKFKKSYMIVALTFLIRRFIVGCKNMANDSIKFGKRKIKNPFIHGKWHYLYRAIDADGLTLDIWLRKKRDTQAAYAFLKRLVKQFDEPKVVVTDKAPSITSAFKRLKEYGFYQGTEHRTIKSLNNLIEQDHRPVKRRNKFYRSLRTASPTIKGMEAIRGLYKKTRKEGTLFGFSVCTEIKVLLGIPA